ncbi:MAG: GLPGLI family protein [Cyclobacteriaceae bacterium]|nr:GLPGLI family protein [Cyclobacteriaceae bacterium]
MKRVILVLGMLVCILAAHAVFAQQTGVITYENRVNLHRNIPADRQEMKAMVPEFRTTKMQLFFNGEESLYKPVIEDEEEQFGGGGVRMSFRMPKTETYTNSSNDMILSLQEVMGKKYLITDTVKMSPWKLGTETKEIMGYVCRMAYYTQTQEITAMRVENGVPTPEKRTITHEITAWYTDQIRPSLGPERYNTLPGTVLALDVNNGERVIVARNIELRELKKDELKAPDASTKVTQAEFRKIQEEQMEKMRSNGRTFMRN